MRNDREFRDTVECHVRAAARSEPEALLLADELLRACWPGGQADRSEPIASSWLAVWGPVKVIVAPPECTCGTGRCRICN